MRDPSVNRCSLTGLGAGEKGPTAAGPSPSSDGDPDLALTAIDRASADELPAIAMVGGLAGGADDDRGHPDRIAADLAGRRALLARLGGPGPDDRDPDRKPGGDALLKAVVQDERVADDQAERVHVPAEVAVHLDEHVEHAEVTFSSGNRTRRKVLAIVPFDCRGHVVTIAYDRETALGRAGSATMSPIG